MDGTWHIAQEINKLGFETAIFQSSDPQKNRIVPRIIISIKKDGENIYLTGRGNLDGRYMFRLLKIEEWKKPIEEANPQNLYYRNFEHLDFPLNQLWETLYNYRE